METAAYIKVHPDALLEWTYDDTNINGDDYVIINDTLNNTTGFCFDSAVNNSNKSSQQLFQVDSVLNRFSIADPTTRSFIQFQKYSKPPEDVFDKVRIYFPINYIFPNSLGFYLNIKAYDYDNALFYDLCNMYIDITDPTLSAQIQLSTAPINLQGRLWGKYIELDVPSVYTQSRKRTGTPSKPIPGTINYNLTGGIRGRGLSLTTPIFIDFRFLLTKDIIVGYPVYTLTASNISTIPQTPVFKTLGVTVEPADDGDYFNIFGTYSGTSADFLSFMDLMENTGHRSYVVYSITVYEENIPTDTVEYYIQEEFDKKIKFRPVLQFSSTLSSISVTMKVIDTVDNSVTIRTAEYGMLPEETAKYGKRIMAINIGNAQKPKIYVAKPDQVVLSDTALATLARRSQPISPQILYKPLPIMVSTSNVVASDVSVKTKDTTFFANDALELVLHPFDNLVKLRIAEEVSDNSYKALAIPGTDVTVTLTFVSSSNTVDVPLYESSGEVDFANGIFAFMIKTSDANIIAKMSDTNKFYVILHSGDFKTTMYTGTFIFSNSEEYRNRNKAIQNKTVPVVNQSKTTTNQNVTVNSAVITTSANLTGQVVLAQPNGATVSVSAGQVLSIVDAQQLGFSPTQFKLIL